MPLPQPSPLARHWALDPSLVYLNHGSFGACPRPLLDAQDRYRAMMESDGVRFFCVTLWELLDRSRSALSALIAADPADIVFLPNATTAVATILDNAARGVGIGGPLAPGDELLTTTHDYPACRFNLRRVAERAGARVVEIPFPTAATHPAPITADDISEAVLAGVTPRTRLAMLSQITSPSGVVMPIERLCRGLDARGVPTLVDGAHGPGAIDFNLTRLGAAFYTANCHKWLCTPKGSAMLWVRPDLREQFRPMVLSNFADSPGGTLGRNRYALEFDYTGTSDPTAYCCITDATAALPSIAGTDWRGIAEQNRSLVLGGRDALCARLGLFSPYADDLIGPMATLDLPPVPGPARAAHAARPTAYADALQDALVEKHRVQVPIWRTGRPNAPFDGGRAIRLSAQLYNSIVQFEYLAEALAEELNSGG